MIILSDNGAETKVKFNPAMIDRHGKEVNESIVHFPYNDKVLCKDLQSIAWRVASQNDWVFPGYDSVKTWFVIDTSGQQPIQLLVEIEPPQYTDQHKAEILSNANRETIYTDSRISMYDVWLDIFKSAEDFHNGITGDREDRTELCCIDMTDTEERRLLEFISPLIQVV